MMNYPSRRASSVPYTTFLPTDFLMFGEDRILDSFRAAPPDFVAWWPRDVEEYGSRGFGVDTGRALGQWILANYTPVKPVVAQPGQPPIVLFKRKASSETQPSGN